MTDNSLKYKELEEIYRILPDLELRSDSIKLEADKMMDEVFKTLLDHFTSGLFGFLMRPLVKFIFALIGINKMRQNVRKTQELFIDIATEIKYITDESLYRNILEDNFEELLKFDNIYNQIDKKNPKSEEIRDLLKLYFSNNIHYIAHLLNAPKYCPSTHPEFLIYAIDPQSFAEFVQDCESIFNEIQNKIAKNLSLLKIPWFMRGIAANAVKVIYSTIIKGYGRRYEDICKNHYQKNRDISGY